MTSFSTFHCFTCRYTLRLWFWAAADVGGRFWGCIWELLVVSFSHSSVGSACSQVSAQVFFRRAIPAFFSCYHNIIDCMWKGSWKLLLALWSVTSWHISLALPMPWTWEVVSHPKMAWRNNRSFLSKQVCNTVCLVSKVVGLSTSPFLLFWSSKSRNRRDSQF